MVLKVWKRRFTASKYNADYECVLDLERSIICHKTSIDFNKAMLEMDDNRMPITFPAPLRINIHRSNNNNNDDEFNKKMNMIFNIISIKLRNNNYLTLQLLLKKNEYYKYLKLSSNNGWFTDNLNYRFLSAFSHFSWTQSKGI